MYRRLLIIACVISFFGSVAKAQSIDAVTSASGKLKILGGTIYSNRVTVIWKDEYNTGVKHLLKYGTSTSYTEQINLKPFAKNTQITTPLEGLTPSTHYYAQFYRVHDGTVRKTNFEFNTLTATNIKIKSAHNRNFTITNDVTQFITDLQGKKVELYSDPALIISGVNVLRTSEVRPGKYLVVTIDNMTGTKNISKLTISR